MIPAVVAIEAKVVVVVEAAGDVRVGRAGGAALHAAAG